MKKTLVLLFCFTLAAFAQDLKTVTTQRKPGEVLHYRVAFDGDPQFTRVSLSFYLQGENDQSGLQSALGLNHSEKVATGVYDVYGPIPDNVRSGDYTLRSVGTSIDEAHKNYDAASMNIHIFIDNPKYNFPPIKSVKPK